LFKTNQNAPWRGRSHTFCQAVSTAPLKALYKLGGPTSRELVAALIDSVKSGLKPRQAFNLLATNAAFMFDVGTHLSKQMIGTVEDAIKLAKEGNSNLIAAVSNLSSQYKKFKDGGLFSASLSIIGKIKVAKYAMFAPEVAKAMSECGAICIAGISNDINTLTKLGTTQLKVVQKLSSLFTESLIRFKTGEGRITYIRAALLSCNRIPALGLSAQAENGCLVQIAGYIIGVHGKMPPRIGKFESHHGVMSKWMETIFGSKYLQKNAPAVLMEIDDHKATVSYFNTWAAAKRRGQGLSRLDWSKITLEEVQELSNGMFKAANVPVEIIDEYWKQFSTLYRSLQ
jgi:HNH/Endo VII superfamily toxin with a SHH signature